MAASGNYKVVPTKLPYIHPTQRSLKCEQIGPSSHKNEYSLGVLSGNWIEELASFEKKVVDMPLEGTSVMKASYQRPAATQQLRPVPPKELEKELLFGHGTDYNQKSFVTTNQLFYQDPAAGTTVKTDAGLKLTGYRGVNSLALKKKAEWEADMKQSTFETMKASTIDSTARTVQEEGYEFVPHSATQWGDSMKCLSQDYHRSGLRQPVPLYRTPLVMKRK
eukprot:EG_transcript_19214